MANYNQNSGYGRALLNSIQSIIPTFGRVFVVASSSDTADPNYQILQEVVKNDPSGKMRFYTDLATAYAAVTSNNNDVILLDGHSAHSLTAMLTVSKSRVHFIGMDSSGRIAAQGARISMGVTTDTDDIAAIYNTGTRNTFRNLKIYSSNTLDEHLSCMIDDAEGTYMENCMVAALSKADAGWCDFWATGDSCNYKHCQFGASNVQDAAAGYTIKIDAKTGGGSDRLKNCVWEDCIFESQVASGQAATSFLVNLVDNAAIYFNNYMINCTFANFYNASNGGALMTDATSGAASTTAGFLYLVNPTFFGVSGVGGGSGYGIKIAAGGLAPDANGGLATDLSD